MIIEINSNQEFNRLSGLEDGFLICQDFQKKIVKVHQVNCSFFKTNIDLDNNSKQKKYSVWFSNNQKQINSKIQGLNKKNYFKILLCESCRV